MANMIKINGRFVVPTEKILEQLRSWKEFSETSINQIVWQSPFKEEITQSEVVETTNETEETQGLTVLEILHLNYSDKFGKDVPVNKKNDAEWIENKLKEEITQ